MEINIHIILPPRINQMATALNLAISSITPSEIVFDTQSPHIPHLTLIMGDTRPGVSIKDVLAAVQRSLRGVTPFQLETEPPYIAQPSNAFVFLDVGPDELLKALKQRVYDNVSDMLFTPWYGKPDAPAHITIGYVTDKQQQIRAAIDAAYTRFMESFSYIGISLQGRRGTCVKLLHEIALQENPTNPRTLSGTRDRLPKGEG